MTIRGLLCLLFWITSATLVWAQPTETQSIMPKFGSRLQWLARYFEGKTIEQLQDGQPSQEVISAYRLTKKNGQWQVPIILRGRHRTQMPDLKDLKYGTTIGSIANASLPIQLLTQLAKDQLLVSADAVKKLEPCMERERIETRADRVQAGIINNTPYLGTGVMVSIIDVGFDYLHPNFLDTGGTRSRIHKVWDQLREQGNPPTGYDYGSEWTTFQDLEIAQSDTFTAFTHGAHTAGIAAGGGYLTQGFYKGIAPDADLILVPTDFYNDHVLDAIVYSHTQANALGKRCVVSMSFGGWGGPMDGSDLYDMAMDSLATQLTPNPILVAAMGNEGDFTSYVEHTAQFGADTLRTFLGFNRKSNFYNGEPHTEFWAPQGQPIQFRVSVWDSTGFCKRRYPWHNTTRNSPYTLEPFWKDGTDSFFVGIQIDSSYTTNKAQHFLLHTKPWSLDHYLSVEIVSQPGVRVYGFNPFFQFWDRPGRFANRVPGFLNGMRRNNYRSPGGTCQYVTSVGAYVSRNKFINLAGNIQLAPPEDTIVGQLGAFSSRGPGLGRAAFGVKPTVVAPGRIVLSSLSSFANDDPAILVRQVTYQSIGYPYGGISGTSMATPMVGGAVALLLQAYPTLTSEQVMRILALTARKDNFTGPLSTPAFDWGSGKLDIEEAIRQAGAITGIGTPAKPAHFAGKSWALVPNPAHSSVRVLSDDGLMSQIFVINFTGQMIVQLSQNQSEVQLDISSWPSGLYKVIRTNAQGTQTTSLVVR